MKSKINLSLLFILIFGFFVRLVGLNWDQGQHLHPDERFLTMVLTEISLPAKFSDYLNPQTSPLNPYNHGFDFFVYGSFPLNLVKVIGQIIGQTDYQQIYLVGRIITVCLDTLVILLIFHITPKIFNRRLVWLPLFIPFYFFLFSCLIFLLPILF